MSTILDALRKAKQTPPDESVDARQEILSSQTHDYLAGAPSPMEDEVRFLKRLIIGAVAVVALLVVILVVVLLGDWNNSEDETTGTQKEAEIDSQASNPLLEPTPATPQVTPVPALAASNSPAPPAAPTPAVIQIVFSTPAPLPTPPSIAPAVKPLPNNPALAPPVPSLPGALVVPTAVAKSAREEAIRLLNEMRAEGFGIIWDEKEPMAMLKGRVIKKGSRIGAAEVVRITPDAIIFLIEGEEYPLR